MSDKETLVALLKTLSSERDDLRELAQERLKDFVLKNEAGSYPVLVSAMEADDHHIREGAASVLIWIVNHDVVPLLIHALNDPHPDVRKQAIRSLSRIGDDPRVVPYLIDCLGDMGRAEEKTERVWEVALDALERLDTQDARAAINIKLIYGIETGLNMKQVHYRKVAAQMASQSPQRARLAHNLLESLKVEHDVWVQYYLLRALGDVGIALKYLVASPYRGEAYEVPFESVQRTLKKYRRNKHRPDPQANTLGEISRYALHRIETTSTG